MKRIIRRTLCLLGALLFCLAPLASCASGSAGNGKTITLYVYNWGEYISDGSEDSLNVNAEFEKYCRDVLGMNVKVN